MSEPIVVVGSGASGVHFAQTALERGRRVLLVDVGFGGEEPPLPHEDLNGLKDRLPDPVAYFLGRGMEALILPGHDREYYGFPPGKDHVFRPLDGVTFRAEGFEPLVSFARGGLAEAWTGGCYPFTAADLAEFPFAFADLLPHYERVARRIGITGIEDDLAPYFPFHEGLLPPLDADAHAADLLASYASLRESLRTKHRFHLGRSRSAVLSRPLDGRAACDRLGRCLWGCPTGSIYTPSITLARLREHPRFQYVAGVRADRLRFGDGGRIRALLGTDVATGAAREFVAGAFVLAAGTLCTSKIVLDSLRSEGGSAPALEGLSDNRQVLVPFVNTRLAGTQYEARSFQYHQLALAIERDDPRDHVHGLITTLKTALIHPIVQNLPVSLRAGLGAFRDLHAALGLVNLNFPDRRRAGNRVELEEGRDGGPTRLVVSYGPDPAEPARIEATLATLRAALRELGCVAPRGMTHVRPMGASVHYTGTLPMTAEDRPLTTDAEGRCRGFENLWIADGATFPSLPAKNLTFTLMANASRIAEAMS